MLTFYKEDTYELTEVFKELAEMAGLLGTEVYPIHNQWVGKKELCSAYHIVRGSAKDLHFFRIVAPLESPKIMGLQGIHSPEALKQQVGLTFCLWCRKKGQNEGTIVNHLHTQHLPPWASVQKVFIIFYYHIGQDVMPCPRVFMYTFLQRQPGWRSGEVYLKPAGPAYQWLHPTLLVTPPIGASTALY